MPIEMPVGNTTKVFKDNEAAGTTLAPLQLVHIEENSAAILAAQATANTALANLLIELGLKADLAQTQPVSFAALPAGDNNIGNVDVVSLPALAAGTANIGDVDILSIAAGDNNIGNVDVVSLPALAAGTNNIGDVDVLSLVPGTAATSLGKAEDAAHASGDTGVMLLAVRTDTTAARAGTDGDYIPLIVDSSGRLHVAVGSLPELPTGSNTIGDVGVLTMPHVVSGFAQNKLFDNTGTAISNANPLQVQTPQLTVANDAVGAYGYVRYAGAWIPRTAADGAIDYRVASMADTSSQTIIAAPAAGSRLVILGVTAWVASMSVGTMAPLSFGDTSAARDFTAMLEANKLQPLPIPAEGYRCATATGFYMRNISGVIAASTFTNVWVNVWYGTETV